MIMMVALYVGSAGVPALSTDKEKGNWREYSPRRKFVWNEELD
jgi:hypothetical protein